MKERVLDAIYKKLEEEPENEKLQKHNGQQAQKKN